MIDERTARMGLAAAQDAGDPRFAALVREQGVIAVWEHLRAGGGTTALAHRAADVDLDDLRRQTDALGARFVIPGDPEWPAGVADLAWSEPVGRFGGEPLGLWVAGPADLGLLGRSVSVIGARAATTYGEHVAADWAMGLAGQEYVVVSGGAFGIDACAHRGALAVGATTVAVMAGGLGDLYPPGNHSLLRRIWETGLVVSEYAPNRSPSRSRFLVRNRLIAALSKATLIVEGAVRSGAQNTVSWALSMQRPVLAVPGPVTSAMSVTPHRLIRTGEAQLVSSLDEVLAALRPVDAGLSDYLREQETLLDVMTDAQRKVHEALSAKRGLLVDELSVLTGEPAPSLLVCLSQLQSLGLATETGNGTWQAVARPSPRST